MMSATFENFLHFFDGGAEGILLVLVLGAITYTWYGLETFGRWIVGKIRSPRSTS